MMSTQPLKKELESIDVELEQAMAQLSETTQRVDEILAGFDAEDAAGPRERKPTLVLHTTEENADADEADEPTETTSEEDEPEEGE